MQQIRVLDWPKFNCCAFCIQSPKMDLKTLLRCMNFFMLNLENLNCAFKHVYKDFSLEVALERVFQSPVRM